MPRTSKRVHRSVLTTLSAAAIATASLATLAACGGGGSSSPVSEPEPAPEPSYRVTQEGPTVARVVEYLSVHATGGPWESGPDYTWSDDPGLARYASPPTVHLARGTSERYRAAALYGIALVNRALPYDQHLEIGTDVAPLSLREDIPNGEIWVDFGPEPWADEAGGRPGSEAYAAPHPRKEWDPSQQRWEHKEMLSGRVWLDTDTFDGRPDHEAVSVFVHELIHALGFHGHPDAAFSESNMYDAWLRLDGSLPAIDAAALQALYTRLPVETEPEDLSAASLGDWNRTVVNLGMDLGDVAFGVRHTNGVSMPWTTGPEPRSALADNRRLTGTATWNGTLLGFEPSLRVVGGDARIRVDVGTLDGRADFTDLRSWPAGAAPGAPDDGETWNTGSLGYTITVGGNYLRSTGGDDGTVNGQFYGSGHEGVAGSVERSDLTAGFGGTR